MGRAGRAKVAAEFNIHREAARLGPILTGALAGNVLPIRPVLAGERAEPAEPEAAVA